MGDNGEIHTFYFGFGGFSVYVSEWKNKGHQNSPGVWCPSLCPTPHYSSRLSVEKGIIFLPNNFGKFQFCPVFARSCLGNA